MSHSISEMLNIGANSLKKSGIESSRIDSRLLLSKALSMSSEDIILKKDLVISEKNYNFFMDMIERRAKYEPLAYILGKKEFYGNDFIVNKDVLTPRPDSETLIEEVFNIYKKEQRINILELGIGSGCLLLTILKHMPNATGVAVDIKEEAINVAKKNYKKLGLKNEIEFLITDWNKMDLDRKFDLIISNPPYIKSADIQLLQSDVKDYEPITALDGGDDGLDAYRNIAPILYDMMHENSIAILECGENQHIDVNKLMKKHNLYVIKLLKDLSERLRCISLKRSVVS